MPDVIDAKPKLADLLPFKSDALDARMIAAAISSVGCHNIAPDETWRRAAHARHRIRKGEEIGAWLQSVCRAERLRHDIGEALPRAKPIEIANAIETIADRLLDEDVDALLALRNDAFWPLWFALLWIASAGDLDDMRRRLRAAIEDGETRFDKTGRPTAHSLELSMFSCPEAFLKIAFGFEQIDAIDLTYAALRAGDVMAEGRLNDRGAAQPIAASEWGDLRHRVFDRRRPVFARGVDLPDASAYWSRVRFSGSDIEALVKPHAAKRRRGRPSQYDDARPLLREFVDREEANEKPSQKEYAAKAGVARSTFSAYLQRFKNSKKDI